MSNWGLVEFDINDLSKGDIKMILLSVILNDLSKLNMN
jgi:hypothetical protein